MVNGGRRKGVKIRKKIENEGKWNGSIGRWNKKKRKKRKHMKAQRMNKEKGEKYINKAIMKRVKRKETYKDIKKRN